MERPTAEPEGGTAAKPALITDGATVILTSDVGAEIYYTLNGDIPERETAIKYENPIALTYDAETAANNLVTIKAIAVDPDGIKEDSSVLTACYQVVPGSPSTVAEAFATIKGGAVYTKGIVTFTDGSRNAIIQDATGGLSLDFGSLPADVAPGKEVTVSGTMGEYGSWPQVVVSSYTAKETEETITPAALDGDGISAINNGDYDGKLVKLSGVYLGATSGNNTYFYPTEDIGGSTASAVLCYKLPALGNDIYAGFQVDVTGVIGVFGSDHQLRVSNKSDVTVHAGFEKPTSVGTITADVESSANVIRGDKITFSTVTPGVTFSYNLDGGDAYETLASGKYTVPQDAADGTFTIHVKAARTDLTAATASFTYTVGERQITDIRNIRLSGTVSESYKVSGVITNVDGRKVTVQDATGGMCLYLSSADSNLALGDQVTATGKLATYQYAYQLETKNADLTVDSLRNDLPDGVVLGAASVTGKSMKALESSLVTIPGLRLDGVDRGSASFSDVYGTQVAVSVPNGANLNVGDWYDVTALVETVGTAVPGQYGETEVVYEFPLTVPDASCLHSIAEPTAVERWTVVEFSDTSEGSSVPASGGEHKDGAVVRPASGAFLNQSGGHNLNSGWGGDGQYVEFKFSTDGFENLSFSVDMRASGTGPRDVKYMYSTDGTHFTDLPGGGATILSTSMPSMKPTIKDMPLPAALADQETVYIRLVKASESRQSGAAGGIASGGALTYSGFTVKGTELPSNDLVDASVASGAVAVGTQVALSNASGTAIEYKLVTASEPTPDYTAYSDPITLSELPATLYAKSGNARVRVFEYTQGKVAPVKSNYYSGKVVAGTVIRLSTATAGAAITYDLTAKVGQLEAATQTGVAYTEAGITLAEEMFPVKIVAKATAVGLVESDPMTLDFTQKVAGEEKLYFGQLHSHTAEYSDGAGTLAEALAYAKDRSGTDFVAFTDHSNYFDDKDHLGEMDNARTGKMSDLQTDKTLWEVYNETIDAATTEDFVAIPGYEMTWSSGPGHINTFNTTGFVSRNNTTLNNKTNDAGMRAYYDLLTANPQTISQFNHPGTTFGTFADFGYYTADRDEVITMVEVGNGEGLVGSAGYFPSYQYYDMALSKGWHLAPTNNQDNHKGLWGDSNTCRSVILTDDFSKEGIFQAMRDRAMYATEDENLSILYTLNGASMGAILPEVPDSLDFVVELNDPDGEGLGTVSIITEGGLELAKKEGITASSYTWDVHLDTASYAYYYIRVVQADKDIAVTAPVWTGEVKKLGITSLSTDATAQVQGQAMNITASLYNYEGSPVTVESLTYNLTRLGETETLLTVTGNGLTAAGIATIPAESDRTHSFSFTPEHVGLQTLTATLVLSLGGVEYTLSENLELEVIAPEEVGKIAIDAGHSNFYVSGDYPGFDANFALLAGTKGITSTHVTEAITYDAIKDIDLLVLTVPYAGFGNAGNYSYTAAELAAIKRYADEGGNILLTSKSDRGDPVESAAKASAISNGILTEIGANMRVLPGIVIDETDEVRASSGSREYFRLYFTNDSCFNPDSSFTASVIGDVGSGYSSYNAAPIQLNGATPLVKGHSSTWATNFSDLEDLPYPPKPDADVVVPKGDVVVMGTETLSGGGFLVVSGTTFFSNHEIETVSGDDRTQYANTAIAENILEASKPAPTITDISHIQDTETVKEGEKFTIRGVATSNASGYDQDTAFFDCIYVQDATGGINVFPVDGNIQKGQTVQVTGYVSSYLGERQLQARKVTVVDPAIHMPEAKPITTQEAYFGADLGLFVKVEGVVTAIDLKEGVPETIYVRDNTGYDCRVFIDGYISSGTVDGRKDIANLAVGHSITAMGMSSHDTLGSRIRIPDRDYIVCGSESAEIPAGKSTAIFGQPEAGFCDWAGAGDNGFMLDGVTIAQPGPDNVAAVTGTLAYYSGFTGFWEDNAAMQEGNFLAFRLTMPVAGVTPVITWGDKTITIPDGTTADGLDYFDFIYRVSGTSFTITVDMDGEGAGYLPTTYTVDLSKLTCGSKPYTPSGGGSGSTTKPGEVPASAVKITGDSVEVKLTGKQTALSAAAEKKVVQNNAKKPVTITAPGVTLVIPAGTLSTGDSVNDMLVRPTETSNAIRVTYPDGTTAILPFAVVGGAEAAYLANRVGKYEAVDNTKAFSDMPDDHWAAEAIAFVAAHEFFQGDEQGRFNADDAMTRAMLVTVLSRIEGAKGGTGAFVDVDEGAWYADAVAWAAEHKIVEGYGVRFNPDAPITREQLCTILARYLAFSGLTLDEVETDAAFTDRDAVSPWAADGVDLALKVGLLTGKPGGLIDPQGQATRAEIATILQRFVEGVLK